MNLLKDTDARIAMVSTWDAATKAATSASWSGKDTTDKLAMEARGWSPEPMPR